MRVAPAFALSVSALSVKAGQRLRRLSIEFIFQRDARHCPDTRSAE